VYSVGLLDSLGVVFFDVYISLINTPPPSS